MAKKKLPSGRSSALGLAVFVMGLGVVALGIHLLEPKADKLAASAFAALPLGVTVAFGGTLLALPRSLARTRSLVAALMLTALAFGASWAAFGPGDSALMKGFSLSAAESPMHTGHMLGRMLFGLATALVDLLALWAWVRFAVSLGGGAPSGR